MAAECDLAGDGGALHPVVSRGIHQRRGVRVVEGPELVDAVLRFLEGLQQELIAEHGVVAAIAVEAVIGEDPEVEGDVAHRHGALEAAGRLDRADRGVRMPMSIAMMEMVTISSTRVKPRRGRTAAPVCSDTEQHG